MLVIIHFRKVPYLEREEEITDQPLWVSDYISTPHQRYSAFKKVFISAKVAPEFL